MLHQSRAVVLYCTVHTRVGNFYGYKKLLATATKSPGSKKRRFYVYFCTFPMEITSTFHVFFISIVFTSLHREGGTASQTVHSNTVCISTMLTPRTPVKGRISPINFCPIWQPHHTVSFNPKNSS